MKAFNGYKAEKAATREQLPVGGYVAKILDAEEVTYTWGSVLVISFDIAEGEHAGFWKKDYQNQTGEDKKWRGTYRLTIPADDGSEKDEWSKRRFGNAMWAVEQSNPGYHWDWQEQTLKGKLVGVIYRNREWEMNGQTGWTTECGTLIDAESARKGDFKPLKDQPLNKKAAAPAGSFASMDDDDLPF